MQEETNEQERTEIVERTETLPSTLLMDMKSDAGKGMEGADQESFAIPMLKVLQSQSSAIQESLVKGAQPGMFINTITNELYDEALIIQCSFRRRYNLWQDLTYKGWISAVKIDTEEIPTSRDDKGILRDENGFQVADTREHFIMVKSASGKWQRALLSLMGIQVKKSKNLMTLISSFELEDGDETFKPPSWSHIFKATTSLEKNEKGSWYGINFELETAVDDPVLYRECHQFNSDFISGNVEIETPDESDGKF